MKSTFGDNLFSKDISDSLDRVLDDLCIDGCYVGISSLIGAVSEGDERQRLKNRMSRHMNQGTHLGTFRVQRTDCGSHLVQIEQAKHLLSGLMRASYRKDSGYDERLRNILEDLHAYSEEAIPAVFQQDMAMRDRISLLSLLNLFCRS